MSSASRSRLGLRGHGSIAGSGLKGISVSQTRTSQWQPLRARSPRLPHACGELKITDFAKTLTNLHSSSSIWGIGLIAMNRDGSIGWGPPEGFSRPIDVVSKKKRVPKQSFGSLARRLHFQFFEDATSPPHQPHFPPVCAPLGPARGIGRVDHPESPSCSRRFSFDPRPARSL